MKSNKIEISVLSWYDTVSPESALEGDYESTGNEMREIRCDTLNEAVEYFAEKFKAQYWDCGSTEVNEVAYATDPDLDYHTGQEHYDRLCLSVRSNDSIVGSREKRIIKALNYLIMKKGI